MRWRLVALGGWGLIALSCSPVIAKTSHDAHGGNCVAYARDVTGVRLDGNAANWWVHAEGRYERGRRPEAGAILVFKPYGRMRVGHVAVVSRIIGPREVLVDQANWVRGRVTREMSVVDASPFNDWTSVKVQYAGTHGRENPTYGFIYPRAPTASSAASPDEPPPKQREAPVQRIRHHGEKPAKSAAMQSASLEPAHRATAAGAPAHHKHRATDARLRYVF